MLYFLDSLLIGAKYRIRRFAEGLREEAGVSSFVATILLILIVVLLCAVFWTNISGWFTDMWTKITDKTETIH